MSTKFSYCLSSLSVRNAYNTTALQAEREVNYEKSKKEVSKWLPLVKRNRESTHMSYPLYHTQNTKEREDLSSFANKRKVRLALCTLASVSFIRSEGCWNFLDLSICTFKCYRMLILKTSLSS